MYFYPRSIVDELNWIFTISKIFIFFYQKLIFVKSLSKSFIVSMSYKDKLTKNRTTKEK